MNHCGVFHFQHLQYFESVDDDARASDIAPDTIPSSRRCLWNHGTPVLNHFILGCQYFIEVSTHEHDAIPIGIGQIL